MHSSDSVSTQRAFAIEYKSPKDSSKEAGKDSHSFEVKTYNDENDENDEDETSS